MAKTTKLSKSDIEDLKSQGYVEGRPETIPENVSPVIKSQLLEEWRKKEGAGALDMPTGVERGNELARERAAADGDEVMQKRLDDNEKAADTAAKGRQNDAANK